MPHLNREFKERARPLFAGEEPAYATTLLAALFMIYGLDVLEWDGLTIELEVKDDLGVEMPRRVYDKLMALIMALTTDTVYKDIPVFDEFVRSLNNHGAGSEQEVPPAVEVAWAVTELEMNDPEPVSREERDQRFSDNIRKYTRVVLDDAGLPIAPNALSFAADRAVGAEGQDDNQHYAGAWGSAQAAAEEIDVDVERQAIELVHQLMKLGVEFPQKEADWTSEKNFATHADKHAPEFGTAEDYAAAEAALAADVGQPLSSEESCQVDAEGNIRCATKREYDDGKVHVVNDKGKTITLYKRGGMHQTLLDIAHKRV